MAANRQLTYVTLFGNLTHTNLLVEALGKYHISAVKIDSREDLCKCVKENLENIKQQNWEIKPPIQIRKGSPLQDIKTKFQNVYTCM